MAAVPLTEPKLPESRPLEFGFAFNDVNFSDRIMRIEILPGPDPDPDPDDSLSDCTDNRKHRRVDSVTQMMKLLRIRSHHLAPNVHEFKFGLCTSALPFWPRKVLFSIRHEREVSKLPLAGLEAVYSSDDLQVSSEYYVFTFLLTWARLHYPKLKERREILSKHILRLVHFPCMSVEYLKKVLNCRDIKPEVASKVVRDALLFKAEPLHRQRSLAAADAHANTSFHQFVERSYKIKPVKALELDLPWRKCIVFVDFKRGECAQLFPSGQIYTEEFHLGEQEFLLLGCCDMDDEESYHCFGLYLSMRESETVGVTAHCEIAAAMKHSKDFVSKFKDKSMFMGGEVIGYSNVFAMPWMEFMAEDSPYFINGVLHLKVELTIEELTSPR